MQKHVMHYSLKQMRAAMGAILSRRDALRDLVGEIDGIIAKNAGINPQLDLDLNAASKKLLEEAKAFAFAVEASTASVEERIVSESKDIQKAFPLLFAELEEYVRETQGTVRLLEEVKQRLKERRE